MQQANQTMAQGDAKHNEAINDKTRVAFELSAELERYREREKQNQQDKDNLQKKVEELQKMRGMGTELVTVIITPDRLISDVRGQLGQEGAQAANIKSKSTRKHVADAIESGIAVLNRYKNAGENGLAIFVGHVIVGNNKSRLVTIVIDEPPESITSFRYRCDSTFELTQLEEMLIDRTAYGLFFIDSGEAAYGVASGKRIHFKEEFQSNIMGKQRQG